MAKIVNFGYNIKKYLGGNMNLEALLGLLGGQDLGALTSQIGGSENQVKNGL